MMENSKKVAIVTGGARGIGLAIAHKLTCMGYVTVIGDIDKDNGNESARKLSRYGEALFVHMDVSKEYSVKKSVQKVVKKNR